METLSILIADDEPSARELIIFYLDQSGISYQADSAGDGLYALQLLEENSYDIFFLDIKMPELTGLEILQKRKASTLPVIIFTTAFDEYALPAFEHEAVDYLLKPFEKTRFDKALGKALRLIETSRALQNKTYLNQLSLKTGNKTILIPVDTIDYFESDKSYVHVHTSEKNLLTSTPLYELEQKLDPSRFTRIHKSLIVNFRAIQEIRSLLNGDFIIRLQNGLELRGSRTYKQKVRDILK